VNLAARLLRTDGEDAPALVVGDARTSRAALADRVARLATVLGGRGVRPGDRVVLVAGNHPAFVEGYLAALHAGAVAVPLEPGAPDAERARQAEVTSPALVLSGPAERAAGEATAAAAGAVHCCVDADLEPELDAAPARPAVDRAPGDVAALLFTSGTAGAPKAAMLTHGSLAANLDQTSAVPALAIGPADAVLGAIPFFHVFGLNAVLGRALDTAAPLVVVEHFDPEATLAAISAHAITVVPAVPAMYAAWLALDAAPAGAFASVRIAVSGATALPADVLFGMRERFGVDVYEGYGLTEASPVVTSSVGPQAPKPGSVGWPLPGVELRLVDAEGDDALAGDPGEVWVKGPNVFAGYWHEPEATERVLAGGWLHTGDIAVVDDDGSLALVDRSKDLVIVSGFNVYPGEVEDALRAEAGVADAAVVGEPDPRSGQTVIAYVVMEPGAEFDEPALRRAVGVRLARYKVPSTIHRVDALPRTFGGKLARRALRHG
jgi:long-chain acyl-CoA synthetase